MANFPARLHVLLARDARTALVLRRGPAKAVCAIGWDRARDTFSVGQWLRGRIYERRADLSPDGKHAIYFAMNGHWGSHARGAWTAISRAPYLTAVALFAKGDCWHGGGLFIDNRTFWLNEGYGHTPLEDTGEVTKAEHPPYPPTFGGECWGVYFHRLMRDGWTMREDLSLRASLDSAIIFEKPLWHGWSLRKIAHAAIARDPGKGVYWDEHELVGPKHELAQPAWEWADIDDNRLVWAEAGKLFAAEITKSSAKLSDPLVAPRMLHDFNAMTFEAVAAPYAKPTAKLDPTLSAEPEAKRAKTKAKRSAKTNAKPTRRERKAKRKR